MGSSLTLISRISQQDEGIREVGSIVWWYGGEWVSYRCCTGMKELEGVTMYSCLRQVRHNNKDK